MSQPPARASDQEPPYLAWSSAGQQALATSCVPCPTRGLAGRDRGIYVLGEGRFVLGIRGGQRPDVVPVRALVRTGSAS